MDAIRNWLNSGRDYHAGVQLYVEHGAHGLLKKLFTAEGFSEFKQQQLEKALAGLIQTPGIEVPQDSPTIPQTQTAPQGQKAAEIAPINTTEADVDLINEGNISERRKGWSNPMDAAEQTLFDKWKPLYSEMLDLQARLEEVARAGQQDPTKKDDAGRMALRIIDLDKQCDKLYAQRDLYLQTGKLMEDGYNDKPLELAVDPVKWPLKLQNHQRYLREYKGKRENESDPAKQQKLDENIAHQERMVSEYKKLLKLE